MENNDFWTGLVNPDKVGCYSEAQCLNKVFWISDGAPYDTEVYPDHKLNFNSFQYFCAPYSSSINNQQGNFGIDDKACHHKYYFACEFSCDLKSENIQTNVYNMYLSQLSIPLGAAICPVSDNYLQLNGVNVKYGDSKKSYVAAGESCRSNHGYLAKISSQRELKAMEFLKGK